LERAEGLQSFRDPSEDLVLVPKCKPMLALDHARRTEKVWRRMCWSDNADRNRKHERQTRDPQENVMDLDRMKVTPRDQQVLDLLVQGCSNKEIAGQLSISPRTVKQHLRTLFLRAGIRDGRKRVRLATAAFERAEVNS
jgi:DNA-binding NarL/FixJ family response regulator